MLFFAYVYRSLESVNHAKMMMMMMMMMMQTLLVIRRRLLHVINVLRQACFSVRTIGVHNSFIARLFVSDKENLIANAVWWPQLTLKLNYRRETALQGGLVMAKSGRL